MKFPRFYFSIITVLVLFFAACNSYNFEKTLDNYPFINYIYTNDTQRTHYFINENKYNIYPLPQNILELTPDDAIIFWENKAKPSFSLDNYKVLKIHKAGLYLFIPNSLEDVINFLKHRNNKIKLIVSDRPNELNSLRKNFTIKKYNYTDSANYASNLWDKNDLIFLLKNNKSIPAYLNATYKYKFKGWTIYFNPYTKNCQYVEKTKSIYTTFNNPNILSNLPQVIEQTTKLNSIRLVNNQLFTKKFYKEIESGKNIIVYLKNNTKDNFARSLKKYFSNQKIYEDKLSIIIYSKYKSDLIFIEQLKNYITKFNLKKILTNKVYVLKNIIDTLNIQSLPTRNNKLNITRVKFDLDSNNCGLIYFTPNIITNNQTTDTLISLLKNYTLNKISDKAILFTSPFLYDSTMINKVNVLNSEYNFKVIYTNKVPTIRHIIASSLPKIIWFPYYKDEDNRPMRNFTSKLQTVKLRLFSGNALIVYFNDPLDTKFLTIKKIKELFKGPLVNSIQTPTSIIYFSSFLDTSNIKILKSILKNDTNKRFYTNNVPFLQNLFTKHKKRINWLPRKCFLPTCALNTALKKQLAAIRVNIILDSALIIYFRDPTDSVYPSERQLKEEFKFFNFIDFKKGFVIKSYEGH